MAAVGQDPPLGAQTLGVYGHGWGQGEGQQPSPPAALTRETRLPFPPPSVTPASGDDDDVSLDEVSPDHVRPRAKCFTHANAINPQGGGSCRPQLRRGVNARAEAVVLRLPANRARGLAPGPVLCLLRAGLAQSRRGGAQVLGPHGRHTQRGSQGGKEREEDPEGGRSASEQPLEPG